MGGFRDLRLESRGYGRHLPGTVPRDDQARIQARRPDPLLAATGAQTETVPPSIVLLTIGAVCGVSINALFTNGLLPSLVLGITLCLLVRWRYRKEDLSGVKRATRKEIWKSFLVALPALALPFFIRFAVVDGIATATEVSTIGIVYCL